MDNREETLRSLGFQNPQKALDAIDSLSELRNKPLFPLITESPDPERVLNNLETLFSSVEKDELNKLLSKREDSLRLLITLFGGSRFLSNYVFTSPAELIGWVFDHHILDASRKKEDLAEELETIFSSHGSPLTVEEGTALLRKFKNREILRIGLRDLSGKAGLVETMEDLSNLAEVIIEKACFISDRETRKKYGTPLYLEDNKQMECRFTVLGMGKLGGQELNFSSDIDLMYLYSSDKGETTGMPGQYGENINKITNHEYFTKLSEMITRILSSSTEEGFAYRVDLRLRPQGSRGDIASSLRSYELYYESWGKTWERAALTKARPVAGDIELGNAFLRTVRPFIFRKYLDYGAIEEIRDIKIRIDRSVYLKGKDVKRGYGGIREIEFLIQAFQLIYGAQEKSIQEKNSLRALHRISQKGLLSYDEYSVLYRAYEFLRTLEHRLQILDDRQVHAVPVSRKELESLARRMGYKEKASERMMEDYDRCTKATHNIYDNLFYQYIEGEPKASELSLMMEEEYDWSEAIKILRRYRFKNPERAYKNLLLLKEGEAMAHHTPRWSRILYKVLPDIFEKIIKSADPDLALGHLEAFLSARGWEGTFFSFITERPEFSDLLISLFSDSEYLSRLLIGHPALIGMLVDSELQKKTREKLSKDFDLLSRTSSVLAEKMDSIRMFKHLEEVQIGLMDLSGEKGFIEISHALTKIADILIEKALLISQAEMEKKFGIPLTEEEGYEAAIAVIGLGKLGGSEITYGSDLDLLFVYSGDGTTTGPDVISNHEYFSKLAERISYALSAYTSEGYAYRIDTRLRPAGTKGPIAQSLKALEDYYREKAELWERQALIKSRFIAGDKVLGAKFLHIVGENVYSFGYDSSTITRIWDMKKRMEQELSREDKEHRDLKLGPGGIVELEFIVQTLQLITGKNYKTLRVPNTFRAIKRLGRLNILNEEESRELEGAYIFLRSVESHLRILRNLPSSLLHIKDERLLPIARGIGYDSIEDFLNALKIHRENVRKIYSRILGKEHQ